MKLEFLDPGNLDWSLNFYPQNPWPESLPCVVCQGKVVAGFEAAHLSVETLPVLLIDGESKKKLEEIWNISALSGFERLRAQNILSSLQSWLLELPLEFQQFIDRKKIPLKNLDPLQFLKEDQDSILKLVLMLQPSASQTREILDLICDLKMSMKNIDFIFNSHFSTADDLVVQLKKWRFPNTSAKDQTQKDLLKELQLPKGVSLRQERQGDQSGFAISAKIFTPQEWNKIKEWMRTTDWSPES